MEETVSKPLAAQEDKAPELHARIATALEGVIDPETGLNVMRMGLVRDTEISSGDGGYKATLTFQPSSPVCPMAFKLAWNMKKAVEGVEDIKKAEIKVKGYNRAAELEAILKEELDEQSTEE